MGEVEIVRWPVETLERPRRGLEERLALAAPGGFDPAYHGHDGVRRFLDTWKSGFGEHRYETREIADAGGAHFALRFGLAGTFADAQTEVTSELGSLNTLEDGLLTRQEHFRTWEETVAAVRRAAGG